MIRLWNKKERFVDDVLMETEVFDYIERLYDLDELEAELRAAGFDEISVTKAYAHDEKPEGDDGFVFSCRR